MQIDGFWKSDFGNLPRCQFTKYNNIYILVKNIPYARHCKLQLVHCLPYFSLRFILLSVTDNLCTKQGNSSIFGSKILSLESRAGYNGTRTVYLILYPTLNYSTTHITIILMKQHFTLLPSDHKRGSPKDSRRVKMLSKETIKQWFKVLWTVF